MKKTSTLESREELKALLESVKTIAVVGLSDKPERDSHSIAAYLQANGYRLIGVNPTAKRILDSPVYPSLAAIPEPERRQIDLVAIFRKAEDAPQVIAEAAQLGLKRVWLPSGSSSPEALDVAAGHDMSVVADKCLRVVHAAVQPLRR